MFLSKPLQHGTILGLLSENIMNGFKIHKYCEGLTQEVDELNDLVQQDLPWDHWLSCTLTMSTRAAPFSTKDRVADYNTTLFRSLTWDGTVPLEIHIDPQELPANSARGLETYYVQAPRVCYLPLLMPNIRSYFMDVVFDETSAKELNDDDWWFETVEGSILKWYVLIYSFDYRLMRYTSGIGPLVSFTIIIPSPLP